MSNLAFTFAAVGPVFLLIGLGWVLAHLNVIDKIFIKTSSKLVFNISLPALIFSSIAGTSLERVFDPSLIGFTCGATILAFAICLAISFFVTTNGDDRSVFVHGGFRSNFAVIGLAVIANALGKDILPSAAIVLAFVSFFYNLLAILLIRFTVDAKKAVTATTLAREILLNPLILPVFVALPMAAYGMQLPQALNTTVLSLAALALPLALIGIGGSFDFSELRSGLRITLIHASLKLVLLPLLFTLIAWSLGFHGPDLGVIFVLFATPAALVTFIMAESMGGNARLAGNIIVVSTLGSIVTLGLGLTILRELQLI